MAALGSGRKPGGMPKLRTVALALMADLVASDRDPLLVLVDMANDEELDVQLRLSAAAAAAPYLHPRLSMQQIQSTSVSATADQTQILGLLTARLDRLVAPGPVLVVAAPDVTE